MRKRKAKKDHITGFAFIKIEPVSRIKPAYERIKMQDAIVEIHEITGEYDLFCKIAAPDTESFRDALDSIRTAIGVKKVEIMISYHQIKPT